MNLETFKSQARDMQQHNVPLETVIELAWKAAAVETIEQKHYELAMQAQAIELFMEKDAEDYGETPLHGKFRAFMRKYIEPTLRSRQSNQWQGICGAIIDSESVCGATNCQKHQSKAG